MSSVDKIKWAMSLRDPQYEALQYFDAISSKIEYRTSSKAEAEKIASENCQAPHTISVDKEFDFPSFCFDMTRLNLKYTVVLAFKLLYFIYWLR